MKNKFILLLAVWPVWAGTLEVIELPAQQDNTLYQTEADTANVTNERSNGAGQYLFVGRVGFDGQFALRRALLKFDIAAAVPANADIRYAALELYLSKAPPEGGPLAIALHRLNQAWGENTSDAIGPEGQGDFPAAGDATWQQRFYAQTPAALWTNAGAEGDYQTSASQSSVIGKDETTYIWPCNQALITDVHSWLDTPAGNHGWILLGDNGGFSARRFNSRENTSVNGHPPILRIAYSTNPDEIFYADFEQDLSCP